MQNLTIVGNLTADPVKRVAASGATWTSFTVAVNENARDGQEPKTVFMDVTCFKTLADNVAESLTRGTRVIVIGKLEQRKESYVTSDGRDVNVPRTSMVAFGVGADLMFATARVVKTVRDETGAPAAPAAVGQGAAAPSAPAPAPVPAAAGADF